MCESATGRRERRRIAGGGSVKSRRTGALRAALCDLYSPSNAEPVRHLDRCSLRLRSLLAAHEYRSAWGRRIWPGARPAFLNLRRVRVVVQVEPSARVGHVLGGPPFIAVVGEEADTALDPALRHRAPDLRGGALKRSLAWRGAVVAECGLTSVVLVDPTEPVVGDVLFERVRIRRIGGVVRPNDPPELWIDEGLRSGGESLRRESGTHRALRRIETDIRVGRRIGAPHPAPGAQKYQAVGRPPPFLGKRADQVVVVDDDLARARHVDNLVRAHPGVEILLIQQAAQVTVADRDEGARGLHAAALLRAGDADVVDEQPRVESPFDIHLVPQVALPSHLRAVEVPEPVPPAGAGQR